MKKLKTSLSSFWESLFKNSDDLKTKRTKVLLLITFWCAFFSVLLALVGQMPYFTERGVRIIFQFGFVLILIPMMMLDYKHLLRCLINCVIIILPFVIYLIIAYFSGINSLNYSGTRSIVISMYILSLGMFLGKYFSPKLFTSVGLAYIIGAAIYASIVFFYRLKGNDIESSIYAFDDKNSAGPIFFTAALLVFVVFRKNNVISIILKVLIFSLFSFIIIIAKCRATIVYIPIALLIIHFFLIKNKTSKWICRIGFPIIIIGLGLIIWFVPSLHKRIIVDIMMNGKKTIQDAFSGRIEIISNAFKEFKVILGNGGKYIDCMPISFLISYGVVGFILLLPTAIVPFIALIRSRKLINDKTFYVIQLTILGLLLFNAAFEGYGFYGPGTKVFALWLLCGYSYAQLIAARKGVIKQIDKPASIVENIKPKWFLIAMEFILLGCSCFVIYNKSSINDTGAKLLSILPVSEYTSIYSQTKSSRINDQLRYCLSCRGKADPGANPANQGKPTICAGQKLKLQTTYVSKDGNDIKSTDCWSEWSAGWTPDSRAAIKVDNKNKKLIAKTKTNKTAIIQCTTEKKSGEYIEFRICEPENFAFKNVNISTVPVEGDAINWIKKSANEVKELHPNDTCRFYYDTGYIPQDSGITFKFYIDGGKDEYGTQKYLTKNEYGSIDPDSGVFKAIKPTTSEEDVKIIGKITGGKTCDQKHNTITVNISGETQKSNINDIHIEISENKLYQYLPFEVATTFDSNDEKLPPDKSCDVAIYDTNWNLIESKAIENDNISSNVKFTINKPGKYYVYARSRNDINKVAFKFITVNENKPLRFKFDQSENRNAILKSKAERLWLNIRSDNLADYERSIEDLGIVLEFEHGSKDITELDIAKIGEASSRNKRASSTRSGLITKEGDSKTYIRGVKSGTFSYTLKCQYNKNIKLTVNFTTSVYGYQQYKELRLTLGLIVAFLIVIIFSLMLLFVNFKYKLTYILMALINIALIVGLSLYVFLNTTPNIIIYTLVYAGIILIISLFRLIVRNNRAIKFVEYNTIPIGGTLKKKNKSKK